jgi:hypothetical protein
MNNNNNKKKKTELPPPYSGTAQTWETTARCSESVQTNRPPQLLGKSPGENRPATLGFPHSRNSTSGIIRLQTRIRS